MIKKIIASVLLTASVLTFVSIPALADGGQSFYASFNSYDSGYGSLNGYKNGKKYKLTAGNASLDVTTMNGKGAVNISLRQHKFWGQDPVFSTKTVEWTGHYTLPGVPATGSDYYLFFQCTPGISKLNTQYTIAGTVHDHR